MVHSYRVGDLAIAIAYVMLGDGDPLADAAAMVRGYCERMRARRTTSWPRCSGSSRCACARARASPPISSGSARTTSISA